MFRASDCSVCGHVGKSLVPPENLFDSVLLAFLSTTSHFDDDAAYSASNLILNLVIAMSMKRKWMAFDL